MPDKRVSEKLVADFDVVFSESLGEKCSINIVVDMDERPADRTREENQDHLYDAVSVQELLWQSYQFLHEVQDFLVIVLI